MKYTLWLVVGILGGCLIIPSAHTKNQINFCRGGNPDLPIGLADAGMGITLDGEGNFSSAYVLGGSSGGSLSKDILEYRAGQNDWGVIAQLQPAISLGNIIVWKHMSLILPGGNIGSEFTGATISMDISTKIVTQLAPCPDATAGYGVAVLPDWTILKIGGSYKHNFPTALSNVWEYRDDDTWTQGPSTQSPRLWSSVELVNNFVFTAGGLRPGFFAPETETFMEYLDPDLGVWQAGPPDPYGWTWGGGSAASGDYFILLGGVKEDGEISTDMRVYDTISQTWEVYPGVLDSVYRFASASSEDVIITAGGYDATNKKSALTRRLNTCPLPPEITINLPDTNLNQGDMFDLSADVTFSGDYFPGRQVEEMQHSQMKKLPLDEYPLFIVLDAFGEYFFAPSFGVFDLFPITPAPGTQQIQALSPFEWPVVSGTVSGLYIYAAMTNQNLTDLYGNLDYVEWGWSQ